MRAPRRLLLLGGGAAGALALGAAAFAQTSGGVYDLSWRAIAGGGKSTGGGYTEQGAIGQTLSGNSTGGSYAVSSGFLGGGQEKFKRYIPQAARD